MELSSSLPEHTVILCVMETTHYPQVNLKASEVKTYWKGLSSTSVLLCPCSNPVTRNVAVFMVTTGKTVSCADG